MHALAMTIKDPDPVDASRGQGVMASGGLLGALAASSCCILPIVLFGLGVSGAWIGNLTQIAPYQPYIIAATLAFLGGGYWLVHRSSQAACADGDACTRKLPNPLLPTRLLLGPLLFVSPPRFAFFAALLLERLTE